MDFTSLATSRPTSNVKSTAQFDFIHKELLSIRRHKRTLKMSVLQRKRKLKELPKLRINNSCDHLPFKPTPIFTREPPAHFLNYYTNRGSASRIFLGDINHATDKSWLLTANIKTIISIVSQPFVDPDIKKFYHDNDITQIEYLKYDNGHTDIIQTFNMLENEKNIESLLEKGNLFIHCQMGISRSAAISIALLVKYKNKNVEEAFAYLKGKRRVVNPNFSFMIQLHQFHKDLNYNDQFIKEKFMLIP